MVMKDNTVIMPGRRDAGTPGRRDAGTPGRRAWIPPIVIAALLALALLLSVPPAGAQTTVDYDTDDDRLIEIDTPAKLNAIRHDLGGAGTATHAVYTAAFPTPSSSQCPTSCQGYELTADIDLSGYASWTPIGTDANANSRYQARFNGNGHTIANLTITGNSDNRGLFGGIHSSARIEYVGVVGANVSGVNYVGILVGSSYGNVAASYTTGQVSGSGSVGGLVGWTSGSNITAAYSTASVTASTARAGGLVGRLTGSSTVTASYSTGAVSGSNSGGLVGAITGSSVTAGYYNSQTSGQSDAGKGAAQTTRQLKRPTGYAGIYRDWNVNIIGDSAPDDPWDFGTHRNYPLLKIDKNGDGKATCLEFSGQPCYVYIPPSPPPYNPAHDHPEIYQNARHQMATSCEVQTTGEGDDAVSTSTLTFNLGSYTRPLTLALSLWDGDVFRSLQSQNIAMPELRQEGQTATVEVVTDPAQTRFRLDSQYGLNLVLGYADCHTDDPEE